jgi:hypothetical protein
MYPSSAPWAPHSNTMLELHDGQGALVATAQVQIACSGSFFVDSTKQFSGPQLRAAGETGYILIRDTTCRLFGFHGVDDGAGGFSFDHMFGF